MKGKVKIIVCIFSFLLAIIALATSSYAWITSMHRSGNIVFVTGEVKYIFNGNLKEVNGVIPYAQLVDNTNEFTIQNQSSITTELRMKINYQFGSTKSPDETKWIDFTDTAIGTNDATNTNATEQLMGVISTDTQYTWTFNNDAWYLYNNGSTIIKPTDTGSIFVLESLFVNGNAFGNDLNNNQGNLIIRIIFEAKQEKNVSWNELGQVTRGI